jgi:hypothetical protein
MSDLAELVRSLKALREGLQEWELDRLFTRTAEALVRRPVVIQWQEPDIPNARGVAMRWKGKSVIQIRPGLDPVSRFNCFCHEMAHQRAHFDGLADGSLNIKTIEQRVADGFVFSDQVMADRKKYLDQLEVEARAQAAIWINYINQKVPGGSLKDKLQALLEMATS